MSQVITFELVTPIARYDGNPWTDARIEEAATETGVYAAIETIDLSTLPGGLDADPANPATRNLTTEDADDATGLWYRIVFVDGNGDESAPTNPIQNISPESTVGNLYATVDSLKTSLSIPLADTQFDDDLLRASAAASLAIEKELNRTFGKTADATTIRKYETASAPGELEIDDLLALTQVRVDTDGTGTWETWTLNTDFRLEPLNASADSRPYTSLRALGSRRFPSHPLAVVEVTGQFGWSTPPLAIVEAAGLLATQLFQRRRQAPFGVITAGADVGAVAYIARNDPHISGLISPYSRRPKLGTVRLG